MTEEELALGGMLVGIEKDSWSCWTRFIYMMWENRVSSAMANRDVGISEEGNPILGPR